MDETPVSRKRKREWKGNSGEFTEYFSDKYFEYDRPGERSPE